MNLPLNIDFQQVLLHLLNFAILATGLYMLLYKPVKAFMAKRTAYYADMDQKANEKINSATEMEQQCEQRLKAIDTICAQQKTEQTQRLAEEKLKLLEQAKAQADQIVADAKVEAQAEKNKVIMSARKEIGDMVVDATEKLVAQLHNPETDRALYEKFLTIVNEGSGKAS